MNSSKPVVLTGVTDNWLARGWTPEMLKSNFGDIDAPVRETDDEFEFFFGPNKGVSELTTVGKYLEIMLAHKPGEKRPPYLGNVSLSRPELAAWLESQICFPGYLPRQREEVRLWFGAAGQKSTIHNDPYHNLNAQIYGRKRFLLFSPREAHPYIYPVKFNDGIWASPVDPDDPDLGRWPLFGQVRALEAMLEPGEIIFIPKFWYHQVTSMTVSINITSWAEQAGTFWEEELEGMDGACSE